MKKLFTLILLFAMCSCGSESSENAENSAFSFSYSIDTVQIDPGDHLVYVSGYMTTAALSPDGDILYNLNPRIPELEIIDMNSLAFQKSLPLEKEGPEGIGAYVSDFEASLAGDFFFTSYNSLVKADSTLKEYEIFKFDPERISGDSLLDNEGVDFGAIPSRDGKYYFGTYSEQKLGGQIQGLAIVDLEQMSLKKIPIPELGYLVDFNINQYEEGRARMSMIERVWFKEIDSKIILTNSAKNEAFLYDLKRDSLYKKQFHSTLTSDSKKGKYPKHTENSKEMVEAMKEKSKEVNFQDLLYDDFHQKIWRISTELDRMIADSVVSKKVLTIFDQDLNQLHEEEIEFNAGQTLAFFREGILYYYVNLEDELGFVQIKPTYE